MPGRLFLDTGLTGFDPAVPDAMQEPPRLNMAPGEELTCLTPEGWRRMRWGLIPQGRKNARGRPVMETLINARSETVFDKSAFQGLKRCVVPATGWYEWTGATRRKQAWSLRQKDGALCVFAAVYDIWKAPGGLEVPQVATVTCAPNADVAPIHHRMGVILDAEGQEAWLCGDEDAAKAVLVPWPDGLLKIEKCADPNALAS
ncbi:SOS response-associated peptidase [Pseudaestuariivita sp.]|uniref:SOS response-associated peptidase n=1 Tax=Pseudaestuariivita sp. TaxID=2211669 RepID=UPI0040595548